MSGHAFDELASTYDATFTDTIVGKALRETVWARLEQTFRSSRRVLELGCGTGEDAVRLASSGIRVVATDDQGRESLATRQFSLNTTLGFLTTRAAGRRLAATFRPRERLTGRTNNTENR